MESSGRPMIPRSPPSMFGFIEELQAAGLLGSRSTPSSSSWIRSRIFLVERDGSACDESGAGFDASSNPLGSVKFSGRVADLADEKRHAELPWISIPARDHQPRRMAVPSILCELSRCRRSPGPTRHHGVLRSDPALVHPVRLGIRSQAQASTGPDACFRSLSSPEPAGFASTTASTPSPPRNRT